MLALVALGTAPGCAPQPAGPYFGDEQLLVMGVDAQTEADRVAEQFARKGTRLVRRLRGEHFAALGFADEHGEGYVRVITVRGIGLALDPQLASPLAQGVRYVLLESPSKSGHDADGDGFDEVFVERLQAPPTEPCILIFRIRDSGFVDPVDGHGYAVEVASRPVQTAWLAPNYCLTDQKPAAAAPKQPSTAPPHKPEPNDSRTDP